MKRFLAIFLLSFFSCVRSQVDVVLHCKQSLQHFIMATQQNELLSYEAMTKIFVDTSLNYKKLRKLIRNDIKTCRRFIKRNAKESIEYHDLLRDLFLFSHYVKKHKECCKAIHFHAKLRHRYQLAFDNLNIVECVEAAPHLYGVGESKYKSRAYFKKIAADLAKIEDFEDTIHGDYGLLKAHNYVYKIELIRIRNHVYHHNHYKYETRYF